MYLLLVFLLTACESPPRNDYPFVYHGKTMGTSFSIKVSRLPDNVKQKQLKGQIDSLLDEINQSMSTYIKTSEVSQFNYSKSTKWINVSHDLFNVLVVARRTSELTQGAFDITIGPLVDLWGFGPDLRTYQQPEKNKIQLRLNQIGYKKLLIDEETQKIRKIVPELHLDLSAIAKGYAVDKVAELLEKKQISNYLVEIGGELRLKGKNISGKPWRIGIEKPVVENRLLQKIVPVTDIAMATSGDYRNYFEVDGVRFSHTIDPRTGSPIKHQLASVTIFKDNCMEADALATSVMVLGPKNGFQFVEQHHIAAYLLIKTGDDFEEKISSAYSDLFKVKQ